MTRRSTSGAQRPRGRQVPTRPGRWRLPDQPRPRTDSAMPLSHPTPAPRQWFSQLAAALDRRSAVRLALVFVGAVLARGRRTVTSWIRAAGLSADYKPVYTTVAAAGKRADAIAAQLTWQVVMPLIETAGLLS